MLADPRIPDIQQMVNKVQGNDEMNLTTVENPPHQ